MGLYYSNGVFCGRVVSPNELPSDDVYGLTDDKCVQGPKILHLNFGNIDSNIGADDLKNGFVKKSEVLGLLRKIKNDPNVIPLYEALEKWDGSSTENDWNYYEASTCTLDYPPTKKLSHVLRINPDF